MKDGPTATQFSRSRKALRWLLVVFLAYAILFGDHTIGHVYFKNLCATESGTKIYRVVPKVDGFWWSAIGDGQIAIQYGYDFVEGGVYRDKADRYIVSGLKINTLKNVKSASRYVVYTKYVNVFGGEEISESKKAGMFVKAEKIIEDTASRERLAVETSFVFRSGWLVRAALSGAFSTVVARCPREPIKDFEKFIVTVLKPINAKD
jgi:hypothetical protein